MGCLDAWLRYLGESRRELSRQLGLSDASIAVAVLNGYREPTWLEGLATLLDVPAAVLMDTQPLAPEAEPWRGRALKAAAERRLRTKYQRRLAAGPRASRQAA